MNEDFVEWCVDMMLFSQYSDFSVHRIDFCFFPLLDALEHRGVIVCRVSYDFFGIVDHLRNCEVESLCFGDVC